jgi:hypothetical protein
MARSRKESAPKIEILFEAHGEVWRQVESLARSGPDDNHYTVRTDGRGRTTVTFGDGVHGRRPSTGSRNLVTIYRPAHRYTVVTLQQGRVLLDRDFNEADAAPGRFYGLYAGVVTSDIDPLSQGRLLVRVPAVHGAQDVWAVSCVPAGAHALPTVNQPVWIAFQAGDPAQPVWVGTMWERPYPP